MELQQLNDRFKDAPWFEQCSKEYILVGGVGGIGSSAMYCLTKTIPCTYMIIDMDTVAEYNVGTQFFGKDDVNKLKVQAVQEMATRYSGAKIMPFPRAITDTDSLNIVVSAFDNMAARKQLYEAWKKRPTREIFIDGRLRATMYEVYIVVPGREAQYEATLFDDSEVKDDECTFKQTSFFAMAIGAKITQALTNYLSNKYTKEDSCALPFKITEVGELFYFNAE